MEIEIKKVWGKVKQDRWGVVVNIENKDQVFQWMPSYRELAEVYKLLVDVEELNKEVQK